MIFTIHFIVDSKRFSKPPSNPLPNPRQRETISRNVLVRLRNGISRVRFGTGGSRSPTPLSALMTRCRMASATMPWNGFGNPFETLPKRAVGEVPKGFPWQGGFHVRNRSGIVSRNTCGKGFGSATIPYRHPIETSPIPHRGIVSGIVPNPLPNSLPAGVLSGHHFPTHSMTTFLTVKEAAKLTGKSPSSIRRILYPILEDNRHADRHHIEPDVATAKSLRVKGENFAWKISEELLHREVPAGAAKTMGSKASALGGSDQSADIIDMLRKELDIKNSQIATQNELLRGLSERLREGNILIGSLQRQLSLPDGSARNKTEVVDAGTASQKPKQGSDAPVESPAKPHWLFRRIF